MRKTEKPHISDVRTREHILLDRYRKGSIIYQNVLLSPVSTDCEVAVLGVPHLARKEDGLMC